MPLKSHTLPVAIVNIPFSSLTIRRAPVSDFAAVNAVVYCK